MLRNIVDGFALNPSIRQLPYRSMAMMLGQLEPLRRAHNLRPRNCVLPENLLDSIAARGQLNQQIRVSPNSWLWALSFWEFETPEEEDLFTVGNPVAPDHFSLQITDQASGAEIASEFISARSFWPGVAGVAPLFPKSRSPQVLLTKPQLITGSGLLSVRISNTDSAAHFGQLILYFLEPCEVRIDAEQCA